MTGTRDKTSKEIDLTNYKKFLYQIGYLVEEKEDFKIQTSGVDPEIGMVSGPQLVVPVTNAHMRLTRSMRGGTACMMRYTVRRFGRRSSTWSFQFREG